MDLYACLIFSNKALDIAQTKMFKYINGLVQDCCILSQLAILNKDAAV